MNRLAVTVLGFALFCNYASTGGFAVPSFKEEAHDRGDMTTLEKSRQVVLENLSLRAPICFDEILDLPRKNGAYPSHIFFAADDEIISVSINGVPAGPMNALNSWHDFGTAYEYLKKGDVVAIVAKDVHVWYGVIATIFWEDRFYSTGIHDFRAKLDDGTDPDWKLPGFNGCNWHPAEVRQGAGTYRNGKSEFFPYYSGAKYVWARGAGETDTIRLRFVIGAGICDPDEVPAVYNTVPKS